MAKKKKNKYGQYFTIESIADFMVALINAKVIIYLLTLAPFMKN